MFYLLRGDHIATENHACPDSRLQALFEALLGLGFRVAIVGGGDGLGFQYERPTSNFSPGQHHCQDPRRIYAWVPCRVLRMNHTKGADSHFMNISFHILSGLKVSCRIRFLNEVGLPGTVRKRKLATATGDEILGAYCILVVLELRV